MKSENNFNNAYPMYSWDICWDVSVTSKAVSVSLAGKQINSDSLFQNLQPRLPD